MLPFGPFFVKIFLMNRFSFDENSIATFYKLKVCRGRNSIRTNLKYLCFSQTMDEIMLPELRKKIVSNSTLLILLFALKAGHFLSVLLQVLNTNFYQNLTYVNQAVMLISSTLKIWDIAMHRYTAFFTGSEKTVVLQTMPLTGLLNSDSAGKVLIVDPYIQRCLYLGHSLDWHAQCQNQWNHNLLDWS